MLSEEGEGDWSTKLDQSNEDEDFLSIPSNNKLSVMRSPRTEEILKNVEQALRKTDKVLP